MVYEDINFESYESIINQYLSESDDLSTVDRGLFTTDPYRPKDLAYFMDEYITGPDFSSIMGSPVSSTYYYEESPLYTGDALLATSWEEFYDIMSAHVYATYSNPPDPAIQENLVTSFIGYGNEDAYDNLMYQRFFTSFIKILRTTNSVDSDWGVLNPLLPESGEYAGGVDGQGVPLYPGEEQMFENAFKEFLTTVPYRAVDSADIYDDFADRWFAFLGTYVYMDEDSAAKDVAISQPRLLSFEQVYEGYFGTTDGYAELLQEYYQAVLIATGDGDPLKGYFIPSQHFEEWTKNVQRLSANAALGLLLTPTSTQKVAVIDRVLRLLVALVDVLQRISASQAERLTFLTNWQRAYTDMLADVPVFTSGGSGSFVLVSDDLRAEVNSLISSKQESVRSRRSLIQDDSKAMQSVINQSQDAANQQTTIGTSILQQLSTLVAAIYR